MAAITSLLAALFLLAPQAGPDPNPDSTRLACYHSTERKFIMDEKEKLSKSRADHPATPLFSRDLVKAGEQVLDRLADFFRACLSPDESVSLHTPQNPTDGPPQSL